MGEFEAYSVGLCCASVCSSLKSKEEITRRLNESYPTGLDHGWEATGVPFATGESNPSPCDREPETHKHYLFTC